MSTAAATMRVASYNLRGLKDDAGAAASVVRAMDPDVLLLQEVPRHPLSSYRIADFARRCDLLWSGRTRRLSGTSLMTSLRVVASDSIDHALPVGRRENPRSYTTARVSRPGGPAVTVASVHLPLVAGQRVGHTRRLLEEIAADPVLGAGGLVVGGDLNESADGPAWQLLAQRLRLSTVAGSTFPAGSPHRWIDAVFASSDLGVVTAPGPGVRLDPAAVRAASDHLPVWVDLRCPPQTRAPAEGSSSR